MTNSKQTIQKTEKTQAVGNDKSKNFNSPKIQDIISEFFTTHMPINLKILKNGITKLNKDLKSQYILVIINNIEALIVSQQRKTQDWIDS